MATICLEPRHNSVHMAPLPPAAPCPDAEELLKQIDNGWKDEDVSKSTEPATPAAKPKPPSEYQRAKVEVLRYCKFVVADITNLSNVQTAISGFTASLLPLDTVPPSGKLRGWIYDSSLILEPSEVFSRTHNVYSRTPPFGKSVLRLCCKGLVVVPVQCEESGCIIGWIARSNVVKQFASEAKEDKAP